MIRVIPVLLLFVACSSSPKRVEQPVDTRVDFETWHQYWTPARACLVDPNPDFEAGVASALQSGRDCSRLLHRLDPEPRVAQPLVVMHPLIREMIRMLEKQTLSVSKRASLILEIDQTIKAFAEFVAEDPLP
jgi:hypothetical protein